MSVAVALDMTGDRAITVAVRRWQSWVEIEPTLGQVLNPASLRTWLRESDAERANEVLGALARLGAEDGGDDQDAALLLSWAMLPAASALAGRMRWVSPDVDAIVAAALWLDVRQRAWRSDGRVASGIVGRLRRALEAELPQASPMEPRDVEAIAGIREDSDEGAMSAEEVLLATLDEGIRQGLIDENDRLLLLDVIVANNEAGGGPAANRGLLGEEISASVGVLWGYSPRTVRRRADQAIKALSRLSLLEVG